MMKLKDMRKHLFRLSDSIDWTKKQIALSKEISMKTKLHLELGKLENEQAEILKLIEEKEHQQNLIRKKRDCKTVLLRIAGGRSKTIG